MKRNVFSLLVLGAAVCLQPAMATDGETLFKGKPCVGCHMVDAKLVGPSFKEVAAKYDGQADAATLLAGRIKNGTQGTWGAVPMPANAVTEEEAKTLAEWVLSHKK